MNKKDYMKPTMRVVVLKHKCHILAGSGDTVSHVTTNMADDDDFHYGYGSNGNAR